MPRSDTSTHLYILGDVDRVREHLDRELLASNLGAAKSFSDTETRGLHSLVRGSEAILSAEIIIAGGDDVLFSC